MSAEEFDNPAMEVKDEKPANQRSQQHKDVGLMPDSSITMSVKEKDDKPKASSNGTGIELLYGIEDTPPWYLCIILGFQHYLTMVGATVAIPLIVAPAMCVTEDVVKAELLGTIFFVSGLVTILNASVGSRLPIVQGGTFAFLTPTFAILSLPQFKCPGSDATTDPCAPVENDTVLGTMAPFSTEAGNITDNSGDWKIRMNEIQGAIILASLFEVVIGMFGIVGILLRFIGPLAIAPTIALIGIALFQPAYNFCAGNWWVALMTMALITLFSQYLRNVEIPWCSYSNGGCTKKKFPLFKLFPVILGICSSWLICFILTVTDAIPDDDTHWGVAARTDSNTAVLREAKWFRFPYPGQWGMPTFSVAGTFGMLAGVLAGAIESVGDYYACARLAGAPPPPTHAINRGILMEGLGCVLAGFWGSGTGTTSYSENIGAIGITKVGSRRVILWGGLLMMFLGVLNKFGALFVTIPDPIIGGVFMVMFGMITAVGISNLQFVDLNSSRNLFVFGFSLFFGISFPQWMAANPNVISTGSEIFDQIATVLLSTSMFVGGVLGFFLDNTIPGTDEERGIKKWRQVIDVVTVADDDSGDAESMESGAASVQKPKHDDRFQCYDLPFVTPFFRRQAWTRYLPFCPSFDPTCGRGSKREKDEEEDAIEVKYNGREEVAVVVGGSNKDGNAHNNTHLRKTVGGGDGGERDGNFNTPK